MPGAGPFACLVIAAICAAAAVFETQRSPVAGFTIDAMVGLRASLAPWESEAPPAAIVVGLDEATLQAPGFKDLPRALYTPYWAEIAKKALDAGAEVVVFDFIFGFEVRDSDAELFRAISDHDVPMLRLLVRERRSGRIVIARTGGLLPPERFTRLFSGRGGVGLAELPTDQDGAIRRAPAALEAASGDWPPTLSGLARRRMDGLDPDAQRAPVELAPPFRIYDLPAISVADAYACEDEASLRALFEGRAVFIGGTLTIEDQIETADRYIAAAPPADPLPCATAPVGGGRSGVFAHAAALDGAIRGWSPTAIEASGTVAVSMTLAFALIAAMSAYFFNTWSGAGIAVAVLPGAFVALGAAALDQGYLLAFAAPALAPPAAFTASLGVKIWVFDRARRKLRAQFAKFLSEEVIAEMADAGIEPQLGGVERDISVMFVDLSGFTEYSQKHGAKETMDVVNRYLTLIANEVEASGGYVDKFIGDAVMAMWNAPRPRERHVDEAIATASEILRKVEAEGARRAPAMKVKVGVEAGEAIVGNVGSPNRLSHTAIGDVVNLAARLEGACGTFNAGALFGPGVAAAAGEDAALERLLTLQVKGRTGGAEVYVRIEGEAARLKSVHRAALEAFEAGDFATAAMRWDAIEDFRAPWARSMSALANDLGANPPATWSGILELRTK